MGIKGYAILAGAVVVGLVVLLLIVKGFSSKSAMADTPALTKGGANPKVLFKTDMGDIEITLFADKAPLSVKNFLSYVDSGFYNGIIFHRVIPNFMAQVGGFDDKMAQKKTQAPIKNESSNGLKNKRGTLSMARTNDPDSATSQFFMNVVNNTSLDQSAGNPGYAVFGEITKGLEVVDAIVKVPTKTVGPYQNVPVKPIHVKSATRL